MSADTHTMYTHTARAAERVGAVTEHTIRAVLKSEVEARGDALGILGTWNAKTSSKNRLRLVSSPASRLRSILKGPHKCMHAAVEQDGVRLECVAPVRWRDMRVKVRVEHMASVG
jgi:hypothetical protein